jgi:hypothetical protein
VPRAVKALLARDEPPSVDDLRSTKWIKGHAAGVYLKIAVPRKDRNLPTLAYVGSATAMPRGTLVCGLESRRESHERDFNESTG